MIPSDADGESILYIRIDGFVVVITIGEGIECGVVILSFVESFRNRGKGCRWLFQIIAHAIASYIGALNGRQHTLYGNGIAYGSPKLVCGLGIQH